MLRGLCTTLLSLCMILPAARDLSAFSNIVIQLKAEAAVHSDKVLLKDVADLHGTNQDQVHKLGQATLGAAPEFGSVGLLTRSQIQALLLASGVLFDGVITGAAAVRIRLQGRPADPGEITRLLKAYVSEKLSWKLSEIEVRSISGFEGIELPLEPIHFRFSSDPTLAGRRSVLVPIDAVKDGRTFRSFYITAEIAIHATIVTAGKKIPFEKVISADDLKEMTLEIQDLRATYARQPEELVGKSSRRRFNPGDPLPLESFAAPLLVRHGETVKLRLERSGIVLTSLAKAEQDGRLGQTIMVRNLDFSTIVKAQVTGRAAVQIP